MNLVVTAGATELADAAAALVRARLATKPDLVMAVPAGRTPRPMYEALRRLQERAPVDYSRMRVFCGKREPLGRLLAGVATPDVPASVLAGQSNCTILADRDACAG